MRYEQPRNPGEFLKRRGEGTPVAKTFKVELAKRMELLDLTKIRAS